jgi:hypothetical protein
MRPPADRASGLGGSGGSNRSKRRWPSNSPAPGSTDAGRSRSRATGGRPPRPLPAGLPPPGPVLLAALLAAPVEVPLFEAKPAQGSTQEDYVLHTIRYGRAPVLAKLCPLPLFVPPAAPTMTPNDTAPLTTTLSANGSADVAADATSPNPFQKLQRCRRRSPCPRDPSPVALPPAISINNSDRCVLAAAAPWSQPQTAGASTDAIGIGDGSRRGLRTRSRMLATVSDSYGTATTSQRSISPTARRATSTSATTTADAAPAGVAGRATVSASAVVSGTRSRRPVRIKDGARCLRPGVTGPKTKATSEPGLRGWQASINSEAGIVRLHVALLSMAPTQQVTDAMATLDAAVASLAARRAQHAVLLAAGGPGSSAADVAAAAVAERAAEYTERAAHICGRRRRAEQALLGLQVALQQAQHSQDSAALGAAAAAAVADAVAASVMAAGDATPLSKDVHTTTQDDPCASLMRAMKGVVGELRGWAGREAEVQVPTNDTAAARPYCEQVRTLEVCAKDAATELARLERIYGMHDISAYSPAHEGEDAVIATSAAPPSRRRLAANAAAAVAAAEVVASSMPPATRAARSRSKRCRNASASRATSQSTEEFVFTPAPTPEASGVSAAAHTSATACTSSEALAAALVATGSVPWLDHAGSKVPLHPTSQQIGASVDHGGLVGAGGKDAILQKRSVSGIGRSMSKHAGWDPPVMRQTQSHAHAAR